MTAREESRRVFADAVNGCRTALPMDPSQVTHAIQGSRANPVETMVLLVRNLPADRAASLMAYLDDAYEDAHGATLQTPAIEIAEAVEALADTVSASARLRNADGTWNADGLRALRSASLREQKEAREARRAIDALLRGDAPPGWARVKYDHEALTATERGER